MFCRRTKMNVSPWESTGPNRSECRQHARKILRDFTRLFIASVVLSFENESFFVFYVLNWNFFFFFIKRITFVCNHKSGFWMDTRFQTRLLRHDRFTIVVFCCRLGKERCENREFVVLASIFKLCNNTRNLNQYKATCSWAWNDATKSCRTSPRRTTVHAP